MGQSIKYLADPYTIKFTSPVVSVDSILLNKTTLTITKGNSATLLPTVSPSNATNKKNNIERQ